jgi:hypothetical protein
MIKGMRKLNKNIHNFKSSLNIMMLIKPDEMGGTRSTHEVNERLIKQFFRKPQGKKPHEIYMHRWKDNIKMYLGRGHQCSDWIQLDKDAIIWRVFVFKRMSIKCSTKSGNWLAINCQDVIEDTVPQILLIA